MVAQNTTAQEQVGSTTGTPALLKVFQSSPLAYEDYAGREMPLPLLDLESEETLLKEALAGCRIGVSFEVATARSLGAFLTTPTPPSRGSRGKFLHFSCHGHPRYVFMEDEYGGGQQLLVEDLEGWIQAGGEPLSFVFVSCRHSRSTGEVFVKAGAQHVVCCEQNGDGRNNNDDDDTAALVFTRDFYRALGNGKTIRQAMDLAVYGSIHSSEQQSNKRSEYAKKFALLPGADHDVALFPLSSSDEDTTQQSSAPKKRRTSWLPVKPQIFLGREVDLYQILKSLFVKKARLVQIKGYPGIGKLSLAKTLGGYIEKRNIWGATVWLPSPMSGAGDKRDDDKFLWSQLFSLIEDPSISAFSFKSHKAYQSARNDILDHFAERRAIVIMDAKALSSEGIYKLSVCLDELFESTENENIKVIAIADNANPPLRSQYSTGFPSCELELEHKLGPLDFKATAALFSRACPLSTNPILTEGILHQKKKANKILFKILGKGNPALTQQIARHIPEDEFDQLVKPGQVLQTSEFGCCLGLVKKQTMAWKPSTPNRSQLPAFHEDSTNKHAGKPTRKNDGETRSLGGLLGELGGDDSSDDEGGYGFQCTQFTEYPQLFPYQADWADDEPLETVSSRQSATSDTRSLLFVHDAGKQNDKKGKKQKGDESAVVVKSPPKDVVKKKEQADDDTSLISSLSEHPPLRSQEEVYRRFAPHLRRDKIYRKNVTSFIRKAIKGERVVTAIDGKQETQYLVKDDDSWLVCGKAAGEYYILTDQQFKTNYDTENGKEIARDNPYPLAKRLRQQGFLEYRSSRKVWARKVTENDMNFFRYGIEDETNSGAFFVAPWGESMLVEEGDFIVMQYPERNKEIYRIEHHVFHDSYCDDEEPENNKEKQPFDVSSAAIAAGAVALVAALVLPRLMFSARQKA